MQETTIAFFPFAALAVLGAAVSVLSRDVRRQRLAVFFAFLGVAALMVMLRAGFVGVATLACGALVSGILSSAGSSEAETPRLSRVDRVLVGGGMLVVGFVLLSTLSRQYVSYGAELADDPGFGGYERLASEMFGRHSLALEIVALILVVALVTVALSFRKAPAPTEREGAG